MKVVCIGAGPAGLYLGILLKKTWPETEVAIYERNRSDDTFGWGVVFSDDTLGQFEQADRASYEAITREFIYWRDIDTFYGGACVRSTGHGFAGMGRKKLLLVLQERARELGVEMHFEREVSAQELNALKEEADLLVGCDGLNSIVRTQWEASFRPEIHMGQCRFTWLGTNKQLEAFTFIFKENEHGLFTVHAYPFQEGLSTFIVECHEDTWRKAGLDGVSEEETVAYMARLFADDLEGHELLINRSIWRAFPTVRCENWSHENVVLLGDAVHTAHFSIGSGTKLAMEDAIALLDAFKAGGVEDIPAVLHAYQEARYVDTLKIQKAARTSREWFETVGVWQAQHPLQFSFNLMSRSKQITYDNLGVRDPEFMRRVTEWWGAQNGLEPDAEGSMPPPIFAPFQVGDVRLANRIVVSPMCQYSATDGTVGDWHLMHLGSLATGGAGLVISEMTNVSAAGRISPGCAGIYTDEHTQAWKRIVDFVHAHSAAKIGIQIAHAGRKASCSRPWEGDAPLEGPEAWTALGPSAVPFDEHWPAPRELDRAGLDRIRDEFVAAAGRATEAGFDLIELHMAHGYLLSSFLSPTSNFRTDEYGGSLENRLRFPLEVLRAVRAAWPRPKPLFVRISATDWIEDAPGLSPEDGVEIARALKEHGCDVVDVSTAGNTPRSKPLYGRMYQTGFAEKIRREASIPTMAVGAILGHDHANTVLAAGRADLCAMARPHLVDPHLTLGAAVAYGYKDQFWPKQYEAAKPR